MRSVARSGTTQGCPSTIEREDMSVNRTELSAARTGRNPRTGEEIQIPAGYGVKVTVGSSLKKAVAE